MNALLRCFLLAMCSCAIVALSSLHAQLYTIQDPGFAAFLQANYPQFMVGDQLDTSQPGISTTERMDINGDQATSMSIDGLQFFEYLDTLTITHCEVFDVTLPWQLRMLELTDARMYSAEIELPYALQKMQLWEGSAIDTDSLLVFQENMDVLRLSGSSLTSFLLNDGLYFILSEGSFDFVSAMQGQPWPTGLHYLGLSGTGPASPPFALPTVANTQLEELYLGAPVLDIGELPPTLTKLTVYGSLTHCIPPLPEGMESLTIYQFDPNGWIDCLSNQPPGMTIDCPLGSCDFTTCTIWNSMCFGENVISGQVFLEQDGDGVFNGTDLPILNRTVRVPPGTMLTSSGDGGLFEIPVSAGSFDLSADAGPYDAPLNAPIPISFADIGLTSTGNALAMTAAASVTDLAVYAVTTLPRPGFTNQVWLAVTDQGTSQVGGTLSFTFDAAQEWSGSEPVATVNGNTATWELPVLQLGEQRTFTIMLSTPPSVALGTSVSHTAVITAVPLDDVPANDEVLITDTVVGSFDPNDKQVTPTLLSPAESVEGAAVTYTIRFQNTGTYMAENVRIEDQLPEDVDPLTFLFLGSSHPCRWVVRDGKAEIFFNGIMLADSNSNEPASHGFVRFSVHAVSSLPVGTVVENIASIFFDHNAPVVTEPAVFRVEQNTGIADEDVPVIRPWPVPAQASLNLAVPDSGEEFSAEVLDHAGRILQRQRLQGTRPTIDVSMLAPGGYLLKISGRTGVRVLRFTKQ